jgi:hypothetical protein
MVSGTVSKLWKLFGNFLGKKRKKRTKSEQKMATISEILDSATPEILGSATRPASAMGQIDPAPPAELTDAVSASPLEPFANPGAARREPGEEPTRAQNVERPTMEADGFRLDPAADCEDCEPADGFSKEALNEWFAEQCAKCPVCNPAKAAELAAVPIEKFVKIYLCEDEPPAFDATHAHFATVGTLYAQFDIAAYVAKSNNKHLDSFFDVGGDTLSVNFFFNLDGPKIPNKAADLLYNVAKRSKIAYGKKRVTHYLYVFSKNWSAEPEDTWSDYLKNRFIRQVSPSLQP